MKTPLVAIDYTITHYPFFRMNGGSGITPIPFWGGFWELHSTDYPNYFDLDVFLGALKLYQEADIRNKTVKSNLYKWKNKKGEFIEKNMYSVKASHRQLCIYAGLPINGISYSRIDATLKRLSLLTAYKYIYKKSENGKILKDARPEESRIMRLIAYHERDKNQNMLCFDGDFIESCNFNRLLVRYKEIQNLTNQTSKALMMFIDGNEKNLLRGQTEERILRFLGIREPVYPTKRTHKVMQQYHLDLESYKSNMKEVRRNIKEALDDFKKLGYIVDYMTFKRGGYQIYRIGKNISVFKITSKKKLIKKKNSSIVVVSKSSPTTSLDIHEMADYWDEVKRESENIHF